MLIDTHAHLNDAEFADDFPEVLERARAAGVDKVVNIGYNWETITSCLALIRRHENFYAALGWHPQEALEYGEAAEKALGEWLQLERVVALGEVGLDYHWDDTSPELQKEVFRRQVRLAKRMRKPLVIHNREADEDVLTVLAEEGADEVGGVMHCFVGDWRFAQRCLELNFHLGFGGVSTFKNAPQVRDAAMQAPLERILLETDCPYLAPVPYRGKRNEPAYIRHVAEVIAQERGMTAEALAEATSQNAALLFGLK